MKKANKQQTNVSQQTKKGEQTMKKANIEQPQVRLEDIIYQALEQVSSKDNNVRVQKVTGYISVKYGNKVLFEFHDKKKAISHLTFSQQQKAYEILKANKLIQRVVPKTYGWKYDTECLLTKDLIKFFPAILKSVVTEAIEERNLKNAPKKTEKKAAKA